MSHRSFIRRVAPALVGVFCFTLAASAQTGPVPRTADGHPDMDGTWTNVTITPLERPKEFANKEFFTPAEALVYEKETRTKRNRDQRQRGTVADVTNAYNDFWWDSGTKVVKTLRTSMVIDPPDGRIPPMTPEAQKRQAARVAEERAAGPLARTWRDDRGTVWCVFHDRAVPAVIAPYGSNYQIVQSKDQMVMIYEWNSEHRVIPLDGRPHGTIPTYIGDSRGHWEGDTLVVETINFTTKRTFLGSPGMPPAVAMMPTFKLTERFTRTADDTSVHTYTVEDPATWTRPWTVEMPMHRIKGPMLEYACNENNVDAFTTLRNARAQEAGKLAPPDRVRNVGDAKATVLQREEKGSGEAGKAGQAGGAGKAGEAGAPK